jgi:hypothetical protein
MTPPPNTLRRERQTKIVATLGPKAASIALRDGVARKGQSLVVVEK